ncbi:hypothetical protein ADK53_24175 [Streptomyces sp. WM6373]|uniref:hypothetical protein n=1 Tax=Streptomyces TaxID=1883 RepID=UPI0006AF05CB|nr:MULTISPECIES: hypothetical protein [unclassified Streptomyces]KOU31763.1 hypothetical protein ADK53_24175 [Streptomyces sp. WM6373]KOU65445.1 hypothetical protein ADK96_17415 [Streptomyces sp. IGB124]KOU86865.1 hypothetical protein ADK93_17985 [Streptomyces sp. XY58]KOV05561.1 hypothetical protein ADK89_18540 [Streptomyces sp. XY37]KOV19031.1 hypothetical protein ADK90_18445 [Streptomyces sp. XY413]
MRLSLPKTAAVVMAPAVACLLGAGPATAADTARSQAHGTATVTATRWTERELPFSVLTTLVVKGELRNTGAECHSLWARFDGSGAPAAKYATQCGPGAAPFTLRSAPGLNPGASLFICRGEGTDDCGPQFSAREFPARLG